MKEINKVTIIGSGPAGFTAALYAARATLKPLVFKGSAPNLPGGQLMMTSDVENFPGFPEGLLGPSLMEKMEEQAKRFGAKTLEENIIKIDVSQRPYKLFSDSGAEYLSETVIIATGANAKLLNIAKEKELMSSGAGVSACATCDGAFYKNLDVAVVGGGDSAMEEALFLTRYANTVKIIHRREEFRASKIMLERAKNNKKISWLLNKTVEEILVSPKGPRQMESISGLALKDTATSEVTKIPIDGLFVAIGHQPNTTIFNGLIDLDSKGYIKLQGKSTSTNIEGIFACGDVQDSVYRQAITAAGSGCMAAMDAERFLENLNL